MTPATLSGFRNVWVTTTKSWWGPTRQYKAVDSHLFPGNALWAFYFYEGNSWSGQTQKGFITGLKGW